jgi:hypothetical protein
MDLDVIDKLTLNVLTGNINLCIKSIRGIFVNVKKREVFLYKIKC